MTTMAEQELARLIAALASLKTPFDRKQISRLPASDKRPALDYVNHAHVTNRLNQYAPDCSWVIDEMFTQNGECWIRGTMTIYGASRVEFGKGKNPLEAMSHFIRRAAMRFGVATDLWAKEDFEDNDVAPATSPPSEGKPMAQGLPGSGTNAQTLATTSPATQVERPDPIQSDATSVAPEADPAPLGGAGAGSATPSDGNEPATPLQWQRLTNDVCKGNATKALNRVRKASGQNWTKAEAQQRATKAQLEAAINGTVAA